MAKNLRVKSEIVFVKCSISAMKKIVLFGVSSLFLSALLFIKEGVYF